MRRLRRCAGTLLYLAVLAATHIVLFQLLTPARRHSVLEAISTNLDGMNGTAPFRLVASALVIDVSGTPLDQILIVGVGIAACLGALEYRLGTLHAFGIFAGVHIVASLIVLSVAAMAVHTGRYPAEIKHDLDYGVSFGALGTIGAVTWLLPKWLRFPWAAVAVLFPLTAATWYGWLPDYSTVGHVLSAALGVTLSVFYVRHAITR
jgi:hypothetical protein